MADQYEALYHRIGKDANLATINSAFSVRLVVPDAYLLLLGADSRVLCLAVQDKELRLLMTQNRLLVNDFDPEKQRYVEKSKVQKAAGA